MLRSPALTAVGCTFRGTHGLAGIAALVLTLVAIALAPERALAGDGEPPVCPEPAAGNARTAQATDFFAACYDEGLELTYALHDLPDHGTVTQPSLDSGYGGRFRYTSAAGYDGPDSFSYTAESEDGTSAVVT